MSDMKHAANCAGHWLETNVLSGMPMNRLNENNCDCHMKVIKDLQEELEERNASIRAILELTGFDEASDPVEAVRLKLDQTTAKDPEQKHAGDCAGWIRVATQRLSDFRFNDSRCDCHVKLIKTARAKMAGLFGGLQSGSVLWSSTQYDKGWKNGVQAAIGEFDDVFKKP